MKGFYTFFELTKAKIMSFFGSNNHRTAYFMFHKQRKYKQCLSLFTGFVVSIASFATHSFAQENTQLSVVMAYVNTASPYEGVGSLSRAMPSVSFESGNLKLSIQDGISCGVFAAGKINYGSVSLQIFTASKAKMRPNSVECIAILA